MLESYSPVIKGPAGSISLNDLKQVQLAFKQLPEEDRLLFLMAAMNGLNASQKEKMRDILFDDMDVESTTPSPNDFPSTVSVKTQPTPPPTSRPPIRRMPKTEGEKQAYIEQQMTQIRMSSQNNNENMRRQIWSCLGLGLGLIAVFILLAYVGGEGWSFLIDTLFPSKSATPP